MLTLILLLLLLWFVLTGLLAAWSIWFQGYIYTEATPGMTWRAPAAGSAVMLIVLVWIVSDYRDPGRYRPLWEFSSVEDSKSFAELRVPTPRGEEVYKLRPGTRSDYRLNGQPGGKGLPSRPAQVIALDGNDKAVFKPETDASGKFKQRTATRFGHESKDPLRYIDEQGRVMLEGELGVLSRFRYGVFLGNVLLNLLLLGVLFVVLWLMLRFQWPHALGQAVVFWLVLLLFVLPPLLSRAEQTARDRAAAARAGNQPSFNSARTA